MKKSTKQAVAGVGIIASTIVLATPSTTVMTICAAAILFVNLYNFFGASNEK